MVYRDPKIKYIFIVMAIFFILTKLLTTVIALKDDPSNFLVLALSPSLESQLFLSEIDEEKYMTLISDENGFIGEKLYYLVTFYLWWLTPVFISAFYLYSFARKSIGN